MFTSSMSTSQIPGARRLWRAQTNPYVTRKLVRATMTVKQPADFHPRLPVPSLIPNAECRMPSAFFSPRCHDAIFRGLTTETPRHGEE